MLIDCLNDSKAQCPREIYAMVEDIKNWAGSRKVVVRVVLLGGEQRFIGIEHSMQKNPNFKSIETPKFLTH